MTPRRIFRALGGGGFLIVLAVLGALAILALAIRGEIYAPQEFLRLMMGRYQDFIDVSIGRAEPYLKDAIAVYWPQTPAPRLSGLWRDLFALGAVSALAIAVPIGRVKGVFVGVVNGAVGLVVAAAAALLLDLYASDQPIIAAVFAGLLVVFATLRLIRGYRRLAALEAGETEPSAWRDPQAAIEGNWAVLGAAALAAVLAGLDLSPYSATLAAAIAIGA